MVINALNRKSRRSRLFGTAHGRKGCNHAKSQKAIHARNK